MREVVQIKVKIIKEVSGEFLALLSGKLIKVDPFVTDCIYEESCPNFENNMLLNGIWHNEEVFLVSAAELLR